MVELAERPVSGSPELLGALPAWRRLGIDFGGFNA
jgi:hypothetical protein